ncbi:ABC transporter substrate-binding protein [Halegenticoccus soli]|uniref:ABC transporter substrate-binding protein n=1 Tax=Halegenticoccus soli TaxID=1985678 RepID=UPI0013042705|nr:ABC transporter substrate-binding protein [Halegenticoccus soli]
MRLTRRNALKGFGAAAAAASSAGCAAVSGRASKKRMRYAQVLPPLTLDPIVVREPWSGQAASLVFEGLYTYDWEMNPVPLLAEGKPNVSDGGTTYAVTLAEGAAFHDGTPVTAEDVKYTFEAPEREESANRWRTEMISEIRTPDERTVEFSLAYPYPAFRHSLTLPIVPKAIREESPGQFGFENPVGTGPYSVEVFKRGERALLKRHRNYWRGVEPAIEAVTFVANHAGLSRTMSLKTGQNDVVERIEAKLWDATKKFPDSRVVSTPSYHSFYLGFNVTDGPTSNPRVREAVDYLFTMDDFVRNDVAPGGARQHGPVPDRLAERWGLPLDEWKEIPRRENVRKAKRIFEEEGVEGWSPKVAVPGTKSSGDKLREKLAETVVYGLKRAGFRTARTEKYEWSKFHGKTTSGNRRDYAMFVGSWPGAPDPDAYFYPLFHENMQGITNGTYYNREAVMRRIDEARRTQNRKKRRHLYARAGTTLLEDRVVLPAFTLDNSFGVKNRVKGFRPHPDAKLNPRLVSPDGSVSLR